MSFLFPEVRYVPLKGAPYIDDKEDHPSKVVIGRASKDDDKRKFSYKEKLYYNGSSISKEHILVYKSKNHDELILVNESKNGVLSFDECNNKVCKYSKRTENADEGKFTIKIKNGDVIGLSFGNMQSIPSGELSVQKCIETMKKCKLLLCFFTDYKDAMFVRSYQYDEFNANYQLSLLEKFYVLAFRDLQFYGDCKVARLVNRISNIVKDSVGRDPFFDTYGQSGYRYKLHDIEYKPHDDEFWDRDYEEDEGTSKQTEKSITTDVTDYEEDENERLISDDDTSNSVVGISNDGEEHDTGCHDSSGLSNVSDASEVSDVDDSEEVDDSEDLDVNDSEDSEDSDYDNDNDCKSKAMMDEIKGSDFTESSGDVSKKPIDTKISGPSESFDEEKACCTSDNDLSLDEINTESLRINKIENDLIEFKKLAKLASKTVRKRKRDSDTYDEQMANLNYVVNRQSIEIEEQRREIKKLKTTKRVKTFCYGIASGAIAAVGALYKIGTSMDVQH